MKITLRALLGGSVAGISLFAIESVLATAGGGREIGSPLVHWLIYAAIGAMAGILIEGLALTLRRPSDWPTVISGSLALLVIPSLLERAYRLSEMAGNGDWLGSALIAAGAYLIGLFLLTVIVRPGPTWLAWLTAALAALILVEVHRSVTTQPFSSNAILWDVGISTAALAITGLTRWRTTFGLISLCLGLALSPLFLAGLFEPIPEAQSEKPHLVMVLVDTLRQDVFAKVVEETPEGQAFKDALAGSVWFSQAIAAAPWTTPSVGSILTGRYPQEHGMENDPNSPLLFGVTRLDPETQTLAGHLADRGYTTAAVVTNGYLHPRSGIDRGFSEYHILRGASANHPLLEIPERLHWWPTDAYQPASQVRSRMEARLASWLATEQPLYLVASSYGAASPNPSAP